MAGVSYRFTSFSLTLPIHLTPQYDNKAVAVGLLLPFCALVASRALWVWHERRRRERDWQRNLNPKAQRLLASRLALRARLLACRHAARVSRRKNSHTGGLVIVHARWVWSDESGVDEAMVSSVDVSDALQVRVDSEGRLQLDRAADLISGIAGAVEEVEGQEQGSLYVRWRRDGKERVREWKDDATVLIGDAVQSEVSAKQEDDETAGWDDCDVFW